MTPNRVKSMSAFHRVRGDIGMVNRSMSGVTSLRNTITIGGLNQSLNLGGSPCGLRTNTNRDLDEVFNLKKQVIIPYIMNNLLTNVAQVKRGRVE